MGVGVPDLLDCWKMMMMMMMMMMIMMMMMTPVEDKINLENMPSRYMRALACSLNS
jgi:hypothetical protein